MLFDRMADIPTTIEHVVMVLTVPLIFPKVPFSESLMKILAALNRWTYLHKLLYVTGMSKKLLKFNEPDLLDDLWDHFKSMGHEDDRRRLVLRTQVYIQRALMTILYKKNYFSHVSSSGKLSSGIVNLLSQQCLLTSDMNSCPQDSGETESWQKRYGWKGITFRLIFCMKAFTVDTCPDYFSRAGDNFVVVSK